MQTDAQKLVVVRDQFALKALSDDALKQILPAYKEAIERLQFLLRTMPPEGSIERELWLRTQLSTIEAQFRPVADRIYQVLPEAQARAFEEGLTNARKYLEAGGIRPEPATATTTLSSATTGGQQVSVTGNLPGLNVTNAAEKGFISPSITRQQIVAAARETGFSVLSPGGSTKGLAELLPNYTAALGKQVQDKLRAGFLLGLTNEEMERQVISVAGELGPGRKGRAMTEALVRTSMAEASQSAHDAFYEANEDLLPKTKSGYRWWWDASNDTRLCPVCAPLDGIKFKERDQPPHSWPAHFSCRCKLLPITATLESLEEEDGPASGSFLEATPVEYDKRGKRLPPPAGYTGDNAYKRPMKIDGKQQWVRRRDLGVGQTTAGDMLQNANEHSKRLVLGKHTEAFNKLTGKGGKYEKDPQGAVRKLLGNGLPPGSTPPRPTRGPKPKPPAPKPKVPAKAKPKEAPASKAEWQILGEEMDRAGSKWIAEQGKGMVGGRAVWERYKRMLPNLLARRKELAADTTMPLRERNAARRKLEDKLTSFYQRAQRGREAVTQGSKKIRASMLRRGLSKADALKLTVNNSNLTFLDDGNSLIEAAANKKALHENAVEYARMFRGAGLRPEQGTVSAPAVKLIEQQLERNGISVRGHNIVGQGVVRIPIGDRGKAVLFHEIGHSVEAQNPALGRWAREWSRRRAYDASHKSLAGKTVDNVLEGKPRYKMNDIVSWGGYTDGETAWADDYMSPYMGKQYTDSDDRGYISTEVWTMAMEQFADANAMAGLYRKHPDLFRAVLGYFGRMR